MDILWIFYVDRWSIYVVNIWLIYGQSMDNLWIYNLYGYSVDILWLFYVDRWSIYVVNMWLYNQWIIYGYKIYMDILWIFYGYSMLIGGQYMWLTCG